MTKLHPKAIQNVLSRHTSCSCTKKCNVTTLNYADVLACRLQLFGDSAITTEQDVTKRAVEILKQSNQDARPDKSLKYYCPQTFPCTKYTRSTPRIHKTKVCDRFWAAVYGCCESKMHTIRNMVKNGSREILHGSTGNIDHHPMYIIVLIFEIFLSLCVVCVISLSLSLPLPLPPSLFLSCHCLSNFLESMFGKTLYYSTIIIN